MMTLARLNAATMLMAFTSAERFIGRFYLREGSIEVVVDKEDRELGPGDHGAAGPRQP